ncbi:MAG: sporulation peptidase YabG [Halanaerobiaceae bacterium]
MKFKPGDFVTRRSYNSDIIFKVEHLQEGNALLRSIKLRLMADARLEDLIKVDKKEVKTLIRELMLESYDYLRRQELNLILQDRIYRNNKNVGYRELPGDVLHIDGDRDYLEMSLQNYKNLRISAHGFYIPEKNLSAEIFSYLKKYNPDILVITGHDGCLNDLCYHTSDYFIEAVKIARLYEKNRDELVIFAGACQSYYEKLITNGANFASSPAGRLLHFLDPVMVVEKVAYTSFREVLQVKEVINTTITGEGGIGGIETRGKLRLLYP